MRKRIFLMSILCFVICECGISIVHAQNKSILILANEYALALKKVQRQKSKKSIEHLIDKGSAVADQSGELESLSEADYALLEKKMKGFVINREEILFIKPTFMFFTQFSKTHGTKADIAYFALMHEIKPDDVWSAYVEQQTDVTGCTIYGKGTLTRLYGKALRFKRSYPKAYVKDVNEEIDNILEEFTRGTCACGDRNGVLKEFQLFIKTFPKDKNTPTIKRRLANIEKNFRFNCQSG